MSDIVTWCELQPKAAAKIQNYEMRYSDAGALMTFLIGTDDAGCARRLRHQIKVFAEGLDVGAGLIRDSSFHTQLLPLVIRRFANRHLFEDDVTSIIDFCRGMNQNQQQGQGSHSSRKRVKTTHSSESLSSSSQSQLAPYVPQPIAPMLADADALTKKESDALEIYKDCTVSEMALLIAHKDEELAVHAQNEAELKSQLLKAQKRCIDLSTQVVESAQRERALVAQVNFRPGRFITHLGGYNLALRRNLGHASAAVTAVMVAGDAVRGSVKAPRTVLEYEHRASCAKRLWSALRFHEAEDSMKRAVALVAVPDVAADRPHASFRAFEVFCLKCDATKQEAIDKQCMHVALMSSTSHADLSAEQDEEELSRSTSSQRACCELQAVQLHNGAETHAF